MPSLAKHKHYPHKQFGKKGYAILLRTQTLILLRKQSLISLEAPAERRLHNFVRREHKNYKYASRKEGYTIVLGAKKDTQLC